MRPHETLFTAAALAVALTACGSPQTEADGGANATDPTTTESNDAVDTRTIDLAALELPYGSAPTPDLVCAGQISQAQMDALAAAGVTSFISLRDAGENGAGWEEAYAADKGIAFQRIAIRGADDIDEAHARTVREALDAADGPVALYCGSSNRVGALLGLAKSRIDGATDEEALQFARESGMTALEPVLVERLQED